MKGDSLFELTKLLGVSSGAGAITSPAFQVFTHYVNQPVWNVPVTVYGAAAAGAALSLFFGDPVPTRKALFGQVVAAMMFGASLAVLVSSAMEWEWASKNISMFAMMMAAVIRWWLPTAIEHGKQLIKAIKIPFTKMKHDGGDGK